MSEGERRRLGEYLRELEITPNGDVLEVAIGTGRNVKYLPQEATYFGIDISLGMLKQCRKLSRKKLRIHLFLGEAEHLPFVDDAFDTVYHVGGINFFNDKAGALQEMIRVAKPGSKLLVVDETEKVAKKYERARSSEKRLYRSRSSIERVNSRLKEQLCLEKHRVKGLRRITIHALFCLIAMLLNAVAALRLGKREQARSMSLLAK
jgi:ubiquinone/menaquinone biosynthesis C-methylase UbiE